MEIFTVRRPGFDDNRTNIAAACVEDAVTAWAVSFREPGDRCVTQVMRVATDSNLWAVLFGDYTFAWVATD